VCHLVDSHEDVAGFCIYLCVDGCIFVAESVYVPVCVCLISVCVDASLFFAVLTWFV